MWLPTPIYERIPQCWFLLGLLFIATGLYLGFEFVLSFWYIAIGSFCCAFSIAIFLLRLSDRPRSRPATEPQTPIEYVSGEPDQDETESSEFSPAE